MRARDGCTVFAGTYSIVYLNPDIYQIKSNRPTIFKYRRVTVWEGITGKYPGEVYYKTPGTKSNQLISLLEHIYCTHKFVLTSESEPE